MKQIAIAMAASALLFGTLAANAQAPSWTVPPEGQRCPSKWGAGDERGAGNHMKPQTVLNAVKLIKTGEVIELAHVLGPSMPFFGTRRFDMHLKRTFMNPQSNERGSNEEMVLSEIGQVGTQFDGFAHQSHRNSHYNCFKTEEIATRGGFTKLGIQNVGSFITRGVLIDVAGYKSVEMLGDNYEITVEDIEGALKKQEIALQPGDAVIIHTGWGKIYGRDNPRYVKSCPGIGVKAATWLVSKDPILLGSDNWPVEVAPNPDTQISLPVHQIALVVNGVHLLENLKLDELVAKQVYEFAFMMQPLKIQGATGSTVSPIAVR
ncbi:MAG: cyclase family protein [Xanthobacteraceae bacterium]